MASKSNITIRDRIARIDVHGPVGPGDIQDMIMALAFHPASEVRMDTVWDFSRADLSGFGARELLALAEFMAGRPERHDVRVALVAPQALEFGILRMWLAYAQARVPQERRLFRTAQDAHRWLVRPHDTCPA